MKYTTVIFDLDGTLLNTLDDLSGLDVLIIEDIIDSGNTLSKLKSLLSNRNANSVYTI